jgi:hypothetical protein
MQLPAWRLRMSVSVELHRVDASSLLCRENLGSCVVCVVGSPGSGPCVSAYLHANSILKWSVLAVPNPCNWNTVVKLSMNRSPSNHFFCFGSRVCVCVCVRASKNSFSKSIFQAPSFSRTYSELPVPFRGLFP